MNFMRVGIIPLSMCLLLVVVMMPVPGYSLTCPRRNFTQKVQAAKNVVIGEIVQINKEQYSLKYQIRIIKILKNNGLFDTGKKSFWVQRSRYMSFGFPAKKGQIIMFFLQAKEIKWLCNGPILIQ